MRTNIATLIFIAMVSLLPACTQQPQTADFTGASGEVKLITVAPGHFHAYLVQKNMYEQVHPLVHVYAPDGPEVEQHIAMIKQYNQRPDNPTSWELSVFRGEDYLQRAVQERRGNVAILAGNNRNKTNYIKTLVENGFNVLSDKPMAINKDNFYLLKEAFEAARSNNVLLYDIMTQRYEITYELQKALMHIPGIFGELQTGTPDNPAVIKESVHHLFKHVSGNVLQRPVWFFDVNQQGEGIIDVTTHLVDLIQWACFPGQILNFSKDIEMISARRWPTKVTLSQFESITRQPVFPGYLDDVVRDGNVLHYYGNGEMTYTIKGVHARVMTRWDYMAPEGAGDTHYSLIRGTRANLVIRQGPEQNYKATLYIEPLPEVDMDQYGAALPGLLAGLMENYPGLAIEARDNGWSMVIPDVYDLGHEAHFGKVTERYLQYLIDGRLPDWEVPNMIAKYYTTTSALEMARQQ